MASNRKTAVESPTNPKLKPAKAFAPRVAKPGKPTDLIKPSRTQIANANANKAFPRRSFNPFR